MKQIVCEHEPAVLRAARTERWNDSLEAHAAQCAVCREIAETARWMKSLARQDEAHGTLPEPGLVWWKAVLAAKLASRLRARKSLEWMVGFTAVFFTAALAGAFAWIWVQFQGPYAEAINGLWPHWWEMIWSDMRAIPESYSWQALLVGLLCAAGLFLIYPLLAEE